MNYYVILLVIVSNNILLSSPIALTYCLISNGSYFQYIKSDSSIIGNWLSFIVLLKHTKLSSYCGFDIYSPRSHMLGYDLL